MSVLQSFSRHLPTYTTIAVVGRPTRGLPVDCRRRQAVPNISAHNLPCHDDPSRVQCVGTKRHRSGEHSGRRPSDTRSSGRLPHSPSVSERFRIRHDHLPGKPVRSSAVSPSVRPTRGRPVDCRARKAFPNVSVYDTPGVRRRAYTCGGDKAKTGRAVGRSPSSAAGTARAVLRSSRIFRLAPIAATVPHIVWNRYHF